MVVLGREGERVEVGMVAILESFTNKKYVYSIYYYSVVYLFYIFLSNKAWWNLVLLFFYFI